MVLTKFISVVLGMHSAVRAFCCCVNCFTLLTRPMTVPTKLPVLSVTDVCLVATGLALVIVIAMAVLCAMNNVPIKSSKNFFISLGFNYNTKNSPDKYKNCIFVI